MTLLSHCTGQPAVAWQVFPYAKVCMEMTTGGGGEMERSLQFSQWTLNLYLKKAAGMQ